MPDPGARDATDRETLEGVRRRDRDALGRFFDAMFPFVYSIAYRLTANRATAEDVAQEVFLKVYQAADRLDPERSPRPWLTAITVNACRDISRRKTVRAELPDDSALDTEPDRRPGPEEALVQQDEHRMIDAALRALDEPHRTVVIMRDYCGCSHDEIASVVGATPAAVRKRYSRALETMREFLKRNFH